jgi:hypothetical protein
MAGVCQHVMQACLNINRWRQQYQLLSYQYLITAKIVTINIAILLAYAILSVLSKMAAAAAKMVAAAKAAYVASRKWRKLKQSKA